jgi:hypothetical protein
VLAVSEPTAKKIFQIIKVHWPRYLAAELGTVAGKGTGQASKVLCFGSEQ